jgi:hypothetical protein
MARAIAPSATMGQAVGPDVAAVEGGCVASLSSLSQHGDHGFSEAAPRSVVGALVDRGARSVDGRTTAPAAVRSENTLNVWNDLRSSLRLGPGRSPGVNGSVTAQCSSESQNRSDIVTSKRQNGHLES